MCTVRHYRPARDHCPTTDHHSAPGNAACLDAHRLAYDHRILYTFADSYAQPDTNLSGHTAHIHADINGHTSRPRVNWWCISGIFAAVSIGLIIRGSGNANSAEDRHAAPQLLNSPAELRVAVCLQTQCQVACHTAGSASTP